ncbi:MAG: sensor N-terminal transmembrane domain-containing protein, partial [Sphingomonadaceae bacterium]
MAPATDSQTFKALHQRLRWRGRFSLAWRILLVNLLPVALLAASLVYLQEVRNRVLNERMDQAVSEAQLVASTVSTLDTKARFDALNRLGAATGMRVRLYVAGQPVMDSWRDLPKGADAWRRRCHQ